MQFSQIYARVGNLTSSQSVNLDKAFVNDAYADIVSARRWSWLQSSTTIPLNASQRAYVILGTTPTVTDFGSPISVTLELTASGARRKLYRADTQFFEDLTAHSFVNGVPALWTIQGGTAATTSATVVQGGQQQIILWPTPTGTSAQGVNMIVRYWRSTASISMTNDSDVPIIPAEYHQMIIKRACALAMGENLQFDLGAGFQRDYESMLAKAMDADQAMYQGDNDTLIVRPVPMEPNQVPITAASYNPSTRPLPQTA